MSSGIASLLDKNYHDRSDILALLQCSEDEAPLLYRRAAAVRDRYVGNHVYLRGLIEYSNICGKNCLYCGVRRENEKIDRYTLVREEVLEAAMTAYKLNLGSVAIQSGENSSHAFVDAIEDLVRTIRQMTDGRLGITLSLGEQSRETYKRWFDAGAHRYLLRIEASSEALYRRVHPDDDMHRYHRRLDCLKTIQETGYQTGTGVMVGLPFQTLGDLADDIVFMRDFDVDMCGMGPFIEHSDTPLGERGSDNLFLKERFNLTLRMIAIMRII
ncbi:[FeFe] hydrogenase H-cluster radical SAM maturase HydE, partial [bacterium]|nr:[FeFe] hydrogenase H-cluster radical SAM maturase HydE [bacterium]